MMTVECTFILISAWCVR